jgi:protein required for attachment to host cells
MDMILYALVADSHVLRVLRHDPDARALDELVTYYNAAARLHERELGSDRPGRVVNGPAGIRQSYTSPSRAGESSLRRWLRELTRRELLSVCGRGDGLVLVSNAHVLSQLRAGVSTPQYPPILAELPRNLVRQDLTELRKRLAPALRDAAQAQRFGVRRRPGRRLAQAVAELS